MRRGRPEAPLYFEANVTGNACRYLSRRLAAASRPPQIGRHSESAVRAAPRLSNDPGDLSLRGLDGILDAGPVIVRERIGRVACLTCGIRDSFLESRDTGI